MKLLSGRRYQVQYTKCYLERKIKLEEVMKYFEQFRNTYFILLPIELLNKIYHYEKTKLKIEIPHTDYVELLTGSVKFTKRKLQKWLLQHIDNIIFIYDEHFFLQSCKNKKSYERDLFYDEMRPLTKYLKDNRRLKLLYEFETHFYDFYFSDYA